MARFCNRLSFLATASLTLLICSCTAFDDFTVLGYKAAPQYDRSVRTIRVPIFENKTFVRGLEFELTEAVVKQIEQKTPWKVVQGEADAELRGIVIGMPKRVVLPNQLNEVRQADMTLSVEVTWIDLRCGQPVPPRRGPRILEPPPPPVPNAADPLAPLAPNPPPPFAPMLVQRSATFVPELGESYTTARQKVVNDMAEQIVSMMEIPW